MHSVAQMRAFWRDIFGDSEKYVNLVFEAYYASERAICRYNDGGELIAFMLGIPFEFNVAGWSGKEVAQGLYLCGLCTRPEYRRRGIMADMIGEMHIRAQSAGYDFCFLVPADDHLSQYYQRLGYLPFASRLETILAFPNSKFQNPKSKFTRIGNSGHKGLHFQISHSREHVKIASRENNISGGRIFCGSSADNYAWVYPPRQYDEGKTCVDVYHWHADAGDELLGLEQQIQTAFPSVDYLRLFSSCCDLPLLQSLSLPISLHSYALYYPLIPFPNQSVSASLSLLLD